MPTTIAESAKPWNLVSQLLAEQSQLSAVDEFANWHDQSLHTKPSLYQSLLPATSPQSGQQYAFEVDLDACSGCKACVVACHSLNGLEEHETWRKVGLLNSTIGNLPIVQHVTTACHHCIDPGCLSGCPVLAYEKDAITGVVRHLDDQCFGCKYCLMMCPYEVPQYSSSLGIVRKCDMCIGRIEQSEAPACVQACPNHAIKITIVDAAKVQADHSKVGNDQRLVATAPLNRLTQPTTRFTSQRPANVLGNLELVSRESAVDELQPAHAPLVVMLVLTQASVGLWCVLAVVSQLHLWPAYSVLYSSIAASLIGFIGVQAALLHLGRPWLALRSILGWRRSWLSREAIAFGFYLTVCFLATASSYFNYLEGMIPVASTIAASVGYAAVFCSAMIYVATRRELWSSVRTLSEFTATTVGLGIAIASIFSPRDYAWSMLFVATLICAIAYLPKTIDLFASTKSVKDWNAFSCRSGYLARKHLRTPLIGGLTCLALAACIGLGLKLVENNSSLLAATLTSVALLVVSQLCARWLYFASVVFARMPGAQS